MNHKSKITGKTIYFLIAKQKKKLNYVLRKRNSNISRVMKKKSSWRKLYKIRISSHVQISFLDFSCLNDKKMVSGKKWNLGLLNSICNTKLSQNYFVLLKIDAHSLYHYLKTFPIFNTFIDTRKKRKKRSVFLATHWNFMFWFFNHQTKIQFKFYANSDNFFFAICFAYIKKTGHI